MAKNAIWIKLLIGIGIALLAFASGYGMLKNKVSQNKEKIKEVKVEGCIPARENKIQLEVIRSRLTSIDKKQETFSVEQKEMRKDNAAAFTEILKRLPE